MAAGKSCIRRKRMAGRHHRILGLAALMALQLCFALPGRILEQEQLADQEEHEEHELTHEVRKWWLPFEAEKPQLADLGTWRQQLSMLIVVFGPIAVIYWLFCRHPSSFRRSYCLF